MRQRCGHLGLIVLTLLPVSGAAAQHVPVRVLPEARVDLVTGDIVSGQVGGGVHMNSGTYVRIALLAGAGTAWENEDTGASFRFELQGRFHLDPLRNSKYGLYGLGGIATSHDPFADWQSRLIAGAGVELPAHGRATWAIEAAFAGGFRLSLVTRRLTIGRR